VSDEPPRFRHTVIALAGLAFFFFVASWNLPLETSKCPNRSDHQQASADHCPQDQPPTLGFLVRSFVADSWDIGATHHGFEFLIAVFTLMLATFTGTLWWATRELLRTTPQIERAYIAGGGTGFSGTIDQMGGVEVLHPMPGRPTFFNLNVSNHGKTPGEVTEIGFGFCDAFAVPAEPDYGRLYFRDWIGPGVQNRPIHRIPIAATYSYPAIYVRFYYSDIFGQSHSSGFIVAIDQTSTLPLLAPAAYTDSD
jgi:hypothetical protein